MAVDEAPASHATSPVPASAARPERMEARLAIMSLDELYELAATLRPPYKPRSKDTIYVAAQIAKRLR
ncbi:MAG: hypothetical protein Q7U97_13010 [Rhodocyclaceae bacterium]|nr:hypothetical protein [Rhodocyclaceae bacterium]